MRSLLAAFACAAVPLPPLLAHMQGDERPNVIVLVTDDQGWGDIGYNNDRVYSPHMDALAAAGILLKNHYVMPQCTPTRVALMTGRYPSRFGREAQQASNKPVFPKGTPTLASMFKSRGYETFMAGKWHMGSDPDHGPNEFGFDSSYGSLAGAVGMYDHRYRLNGPYANTWHRDGKLIDGFENGTHATDLVAKEAVAVIEAERDAPFFLYVPFHAVHTPLDERGRFVDRPTQLDPDNPERWLDEDEIPWFNDPAGKIQREKDPEKRLLLAAVHHLDDAIGRIVEALERTGQTQDTLILFTSDNGPQVNWGGNAYPADLKLTDFNQPIPMRGSKTHTWEGGIHVPGFVVWPGKIEPRIEDTPTHVVDWFPTLAKLIGFEPGSPIVWDGSDVSSMWFDDANLPTREFYWVWSSASSRWALRHGDWKIVRYRKGPAKQPSGWQLFNLAKDPTETTNVAEQHPEVLRAMHERFLAQRAMDRS